MSEATHDLHGPPVPAGGPLITPVTVTCAVAVLAMLAVLVVRFAHGIGSVSNMNDGYPWGIWIVVDVVAGSALAAGGFATALLVYILNRGEYHPIIRPALVASLLGYTMAGVSVILDLGKWWDFWHIFWPKYAQINSVLFEVALCIAAYITVMWIEFMPVVMERLGWEGPRRKLNNMLWVFIAIGVLLPTMHQSSLGTLLVVFGPQIHPLYQSFMLPVLFLTSCIGMGFAAVTLEGGISAVGLERPFEKELLGKLLQIGRGLMAIFFVVRFADIFYRGVFGYAFQATWPALTFWVENLLLSTPLWLLASKESRMKSRLVFLAAACMAAGGVVYRISAFLVAYDTGAGWHYFPSLAEMTITVGLLALETLAVIIAFRVLPIIPLAPPVTPSANAAGSRTT